LLLKTQILKKQKQTKIITFYNKTQITILTHKSNSLIFLKT